MSETALSSASASRTCAAHKRLHVCTADLIPTPDTNRLKPTLGNGGADSGTGHVQDEGDLGDAKRVPAAKRRLETTPFCSVLRLKFETLRTLIPGVLAVVSKPTRYETVKAVRAG